MNQDLQWWANLAQIIGLPLAILPLLVAVAQYLWPQPRILKIPAWVLTGILGFFLGVFAISFVPDRCFDSDTIPPSETTPIESLPFRVWPFEGIHEKDGSDTWNPQLARAGLSIQNNDGNIDYQLKADISDTVDAYAGIGFAFTRSEDMSEYEAIEIRITFDDSSTRCGFKMVDLNDNKHYIHNLGGNSISGENITVRIDGNEKEHIITIPLIPNFETLNLQAISEISFSTDNSGIFTVTDVGFVRYSSPK